MNRAGVRRLFLRMLASLPIPGGKGASAHRILLMRPDHLGDLLFMTPALHALRQAQPRAHIACLVGPWGEPVLYGNPDVDEIITCDFPWFNRRPKPPPWQPYSLLWQEAQRLRAMRFGVAVIMRFDFWWGAALARLAGIPRRIGYDVPNVLPFLTDPVPYKPGLHEVVQNARLVLRSGAFFQGKGWGEGTESGDLLGPLRFTISPGDAAWAERLLGTVSGAGQATARFIAIHPGAGAAVKLWPSERWGSTAQALASRYGATIVLTGSAAENPLVYGIAARLNTPHVELAGQTSLGQLAAVFARCSLVVGPDCGPLHLASAVGTPTVHLFGPVDPALFGPWGDPAKHVVVQARYAGTPCHFRPCNRLDFAAHELPSHPCMQTITPDDVLAAVERLAKEWAT